MAREGCGGSRGSNKKAKGKFHFGFSRKLPHEEDVLLGN